MGSETRWNFGIKPRDAAGGVGALPCLGTGLRGGLGSVGFTVGLKELRGLFQPESFWGCVGKSGLCGEIAAFRFSPPCCAPGHVGNAGMMGAIPGRWEPGWWEQASMALHSLCLKFTSGIPGISGKSLEKPQGQCVPVAERALRPRHRRNGCSAP